MGLRGGASRWAVVFIHQQAVGNRVGSCDKVSLPTQIRHLLTVGMTVGDGLRPAECHTHGYIQDALAGMEQSHPLSSTTIAYLWRREPLGVLKMLRSPLREVLDAEPPLRSLRSLCVRSTFVRKAR